MTYLNLFIINYEMKLQNLTQQKITNWKCELCNWEWSSRLTYPPKYCSRCKRADWNEVKKKKEKKNGN